MRVSGWLSETVMCVVSETFISSWWVVKGVKEMRKIGKLCRQMQSALPAFVWTLIDVCKSYVSALCVCVFMCVCARARVFMLLR